MRIFSKYLLLTLLCVFFLNILNADELEPIKLQLKWKHQFQFAGYYAAIEKGYYRDAGFDVEVRELGDKETPFDAVSKGRAEFGTSTTDILLARSQGIKVVVLATIFQHSPHVFVTLKSSGISSVQGFVSKRIAIEPGAAELYAYITAEGVSLNRVFTEDFDFNYDKLTNGAVDAISAYSTDEPYTLTLSGHEINVLYPLSAGIDFYGDLLYTSEDMIKKHPQMVEKFRTASLRGWSYAMHNTDEIVNLVYTKYSKRHSLEHLRFEANQMQKLIMPNEVEIGYTNPRKWEVILDTYKTLNMADQSASTKGLLYTDYLAQKIKIPWKYIMLFSVALLIALSIIIFYYYTSKKLQKEIAKREKVQNELTVREALYRSILKASPDPVLVSDVRGYIQEVSFATVPSLGYSSESEIIGKNTRDVVHPEERKKAFKDMFLLFDGKYRGPKEYRLVKFDGSVIFAEINAEAIRDAAGKPTGLVFVVRNIMERKQREAEIKQKNLELERTNAEKDKFFSIIAHDLRSPFQAFLGLTQVLLEQIDTIQQDKVKHFAGILNKSAITLFRLLENLLEWSRIERGLTTPQPSIFSVNYALEETLKMFKDAIQLKKQTLEIKFLSDVKVIADLRMTETIMRNLLSNAIKFTPAGGRIVVSTKQVDDQNTKITISDTGIGMSKEILDNLFRIDTNNRRLGTDGESSSGLGLLLCKELIELNNGTLTVKSEEGKGSEFSFTLKINEEDME